MMKGAITQLVTDRGFGFIKTEDGKELFFHRNETVGVEFSRLRIGQEVTFEMGQDKKGRSQAVKVTLIETKAPEQPPSQ
jgi:cold shock CspA family protein